MSPHAACRPIACDRKGSLPKNRIDAAVASMLLIAPLAANGLYVPIIAQEPTLFWAHEVILWIVWPMGVLLWLRERGLSLADFGLHGRLLGRNLPSVVLVISIVGLLIGPAIAESFLQIAWGNHSDTGEWSYRGIVPARGPVSGWYRLLAIFFLAISAGVVEEVVFRGVLYSAFRSNCLRAATLFVLCSTATFAAIHWESGVSGLIYASLWGATLSVLRIAAGNLWPCIMIHFAVDLAWLW